MQANLMVSKERREFLSRAGIVAAGVLTIGTGLTPRAVSAEGCAVERLGELLGAAEGVVGLVLAGAGGITMVGASKIGSALGLSAAATGAVTGAITLGGFAVMAVGVAIVLGVIYKKVLKPQYMELKDRLGLL